MATQVAKRHAGGAPGYYWEEDGDVLEIEDEDARGLLSMGTEFFEVFPADEPEVVKVVATPEVAPAAPPEFPSSTGGIKEAIEVASVTNTQKKG